MRLLHTTDLRFEEIFESEVPKYAILSHRWISGQEVSYEDFIQGGKPEASGWKKLRWFASLAKDTYECEWCWIDTCCIDKKSSAELSEAINSMFLWYEKASACVAYLFDVHSSSIDALEQSEWFKRGWTLQELLAPENVVFYSCDYELIGNKANLYERISHITNIAPIYLGMIEDPSSASVAEKMSWAASRRTTREEDVAYSLLGLFEVNMPLLYGEGQNAFYRLQLEILKDNDDETIFAWTEGLGPYPHGPDIRLWTSGMLAMSPDNFAKSGKVEDSMDARMWRPSYAMSNKGLEIEVPKPIQRLQLPGSSNMYYLMHLDCYLDSYTSDFGQRKWIYLLLTHIRHNTWARVGLPFHIISTESQIITRDTGGQLQLEAIRIHGPPVYKSRDIGPFLLDYIQPDNKTFVELESNFKMALERLGLRPGH